MTTINQNVFLIKNGQEVIDIPTNYSHILKIDKFDGVSYFIQR